MEGRTRLRKCILRAKKKPRDSAIRPNKGSFIFPLVTVACHKVVPSAGLGANLAILEGVNLCNLLVDLPRPITAENITKVFEAYYDQRAKIAKAALANSRQFGKVMGDRVRIEVLGWYV